MDGDFLLSVSSESYGFSTRQWFAVRAAAPVILCHDAALEERDGVFSLVSAGMLEPVRLGGDILVGAYLYTVASVEQSFDGA